jgi:hypothetical protein
MADVFEPVRIVMVICGAVKATGPLEGTRIFTQGRDNVWNLGLDWHGLENSLYEIVLLRLKKYTF